jgi:hypothetical protein
VGRLSLHSSRSDFLSAHIPNLSVGWLGEFRSTHTPGRVDCSFAGPDRTPKFIATWSGSALPDNPGARNFLHQVLQLILPQASCSISRAELSLHSSCFRPLARLAFLSRDPAACSGLHASPVSAASPHPWFEVRLRTRQRPRVSRFSVRFEAHAFELPDVLAWRQVPHHGLPRLPFRSHGTLFLFTAPGPA